MMDKVLFWVGFAPAFFLALMGWYALTPKPPGGIGIALCMGGAWVIGSGVRQLGRVFRKT